MNQIIFQRTGKGTSLCTLCGEEEESVVHLFKKCKVTILLAFASNWSCYLDAWNLETVNALVSFCVHPPTEVGTLG